MNGEINRLKQDLKIIEEAMDCKPEFDPRILWLCIGWGLASLILIFKGAFPDMVAINPWIGLWGRTIFLVLLVALPEILCRLFVPKLPSLFFSVFTPSVSLFSVLRSLISSLVPCLGVVGFLFWLHKLGATSEIKCFSGLVLTGSICVVCAWKKPQFYWILPFGWAMVTLGLINPLIPGRYYMLAFGIIMALTAFSGALILDQQLKTDQKNGKAAH